ncbi:hypothetical protein I203_100696 [Kwoniella mangroviensis CBS 8507]|uniref:uncharacterized protein n=1 Tax=Kwoniella mangroviensis CBS 8507 TaxID=1296122 RepID=UPI00080CC0BF|nr:uncharacterized protein I203_06770 [Kwoniella mangroviensis CBS 8507]OCF64186.1 hypothetical protein I203_06770 [Kwoniella mangroviensis CBS 8507]
MSEEETEYGYESSDGDDESTVSEMTGSQFRSGQGEIKDRIVRLTQALGEIDLHINKILGTTQVSTEDGHKCLVEKIDQKLEVQSELGFCQAFLGKNGVHADLLNYYCVYYAGNQLGLDTDPEINASRAADLASKSFLREIAKSNRELFAVDLSKTTEQIMSDVASDLADEVAHTPSDVDRIKRLSTSQAVQSWIASFPPGQSQTAEEWEG